MSSPNSPSTIAGRGQFAYDPITFSVIRNRFDAISAEMALVLERSAWSSNLALAHDYSCGIYDATPRQVSMFDALPIHTTSMQLVVAEIASYFSEDIHDGDVFICNDPRFKNTHIGDLVVIAPVFEGGEVVFWSVTKGHQLDIGAFVASSVTASAENVWQEGITVPPTKLLDQDVLRKDVFAMFLANVRFADLVEGDVRAMIGSVDRGKQRLHELCTEYSTPVVLRYVDVLMDYASRRMSQEIQNMPDGIYTASGWIDSDGIDRENVEIQVAVSIDGDHVVVDYSGSASQGRGGVNGTYATTLAAGAIPFLHYVDPDIPHNQGCIDHIDVVAEEGSICWALFPASTSCATIVPSDLMQDVVNKAMVEAMPERVPAGGTRCQNLVQFSSSVGPSNVPWSVLLMNNAGGFGASWGYDGWPLCYTLAALGAMKIESVEQIELLYPLRVEMWEIEPESMGFGRWNGGPGNRLAVRPLVTDTIAVTWGDGSSNPPHGALGGHAGIGGGQYIEGESGGRRYVSACGNMRVERERGEVWTGVSTGGGGFGNAIERRAEDVRRDVRDELLTRETAVAVYGVVLTHTADPEIDEQATAGAREALTHITRPNVDPLVPGAATWLARSMRDGDTYLVNPLL